MEGEIFKFKQELLTLIRDCERYSVLQSVVVYLKDIYYSKEYIVVNYVPQRSSFSTTAKEILEINGYQLK